MSEKEFICPKCLSKNLFFGIPTPILPPMFAIISCLDCNFSSSGYNFWNSKLEILKKERESLEKKEKELYKRLSEPSKPPNLLCPKDWDFE